MRTWCVLHACGHLQSLDGLNDFIEYNKLPRALGRHLREYTHQMKGIRLQEYASTHLQSLSPVLQRDVVLHCHRSWIECADVQPPQASLRTPSPRSLGANRRRPPLTMPLSTARPSRVVVSWRCAARRLCNAQRHLVSA
jgi:hypothetical protein